MERQPAGNMGFLLLLSPLWGTGGHDYTALTSQIGPPRGPSAVSTTPTIIIAQHSRMTGKRPLRIGAVSYLNSKPLVHGLEKFMPGAELEFDLPSRLADRLSLGELDVALIPSIEAFQNPNYSIVSDACIGCRGPVWSVKLLGRVPAGEIRTLALDEGSRTSAALSQILLWKRYGIRPEVRLLSMDQDYDQVDTDAVVIIGDRAMGTPAGDWNFSWDLGDEWCELTELPFVFALWTAGPDADLEGVDNGLELARDAGESAAEIMAADEAPRYGISYQQCLDYFQRNLYFHLGTREREALALFYRYAAEMELAPSGVELRFYDCETT